MSAPAILTALVLVAASGCADPMHAWKSSLVRYVNKQGNGDLNALRQLQGSPAEGDFSLLGAGHGGFPLFAPRRTDAHGELLGRREFVGHDWFIFLLGLVEYQGKLADWPLDAPRLIDLRLVAVSAVNGKFRWLVGPPDPQALEQYGQPQLEAWRRSDPSRAAALTAPTRFPTPADILQLSVDADAIIAVDEHSGARWTLPLVAPGAAAGPAVRTTP